MLHVFVFPSVTDVIITRHRQNIYLPVYERRWRRAALGVEGRAGGKGEEVAVAVAGGADSMTRGEIRVGGDPIAGDTKAVGAGIGGVRLAGVVVEKEVGVAHLAAEVVTLVAADGAVVSALLELDFMSCCPPFLSNITRFFFFVHRRRSWEGLLW